MKPFLLAFLYMFAVIVLLDIASGIQTKGLPTLSWARIGRVIAFNAGLILYATQVWPRLVGR